MSSSTSRRRSFAEKRRELIFDIFFPMPFFGILIVHALIAVIGRTQLRTPLDSAMDAASVAFIIVNYGERRLRALPLSKRVGLGVLAAAAPLAFTGFNAFGAAAIVGLVGGALFALGTRFADREYREMYPEPEAPSPTRTAPET